MKTKLSTLKWAVLCLFVFQLNALSQTTTEESLISTGEIYEHNSATPSSTNLLPTDVYMRTGNKINFRLNSKGYLGIGLDNINPEAAFHLQGAKKYAPSSYGIQMGYDEDYALNSYGIEISSINPYIDFTKPGTDNLARIVRWSDRLEIQPGEHSFLNVIGKVRANQYSAEAGSGNHTGYRFHTDGLGDHKTGMNYSPSTGELGLHAYDILAEPDPDDPSRALHQSIMLNTDHVFIGKRDVFHNQKRYDVEIFGNQASDESTTVVIRDPRNPLDIDPEHNSQFNLFVTNGIWSEDFAISTKAEIGQPDYVFAKEYQLSSLDELETYINTHKHLPDVPSVSEIEEKGYLSLLAQSTGTLKNLEEQVLHNIAQEKKIQDQESKILAQARENEELRKQLADQNERIKRLEKLILKK